MNKFDRIHTVVRQAAKAERAETDAETKALLMQQKFFSTVRWRCTRITGVGPRTWRDYLRIVWQMGEEITPVDLMK